MPLAASAGIAGTLVDLFLVLLAAKAGDELFKRIGQPGIALAEGAVSREFFAVVVGMSVLTTLFAPPVLRALARPRQSSYA